MGNMQTCLMFSMCLNKIKVTQISISEFPNWDHILKHTAGVCLDHNLDIFDYLRESTTAYPEK